MGPMSVDAIDGSRFLAQFVDDCTGVLVSSPLRLKAEIVEKLDEYLIMIKANGHTPRRVRSDNALEFDSQQMKAMCRRHQVKHEFSAPYSPEQMGRIERQNRTSGEGIRTNLIAAGLPLTLWNEVAKTVAYIRNRIPLKRLDGRTPYEAFTGNKPDISHLHVLGSTAYVLIDKQHRKKLDSKSKRMVLVGYEPGSRAYRLWETGTRRVVVSRDVKIIEPEPKHIAALLPMIEKTELVLPVEEDDNEKIERDKPVGDLKPVSARTRSKTQAEANMAILLCAEAAPQSYKEAIESNNADDWRMAMDSEMASLTKNDTWTLVKLPAGRKAICNKWIYRVKTRPNGSIERYKARLVVKGCSQQPEEDFNETFSPVARFESIRLLLAIAATRDCTLKQIDIKTAFLYGDLDEIIFMHQPEGYNDGSDRVCQLKKSLYGLKQAPRQWHSKFDGVLQKFGLEPTNGNPCVYTNSHSNLYLALYVDDGLIVSNSNEQVKELVTAIKQHFDVTVIDAECYLGLQIEYDREMKIMHIHQTAYAHSVLNKFKMVDCNAIKTPMDVNAVIQANVANEGKQLPAANVPYRELIGSLMYLSVGTRPDIAFAVSKLSKYLANPSNEHWLLAKRILRYLKGTVDFGITFRLPTDGINQLVAYSDADYAACLDTRKSTSGVVVTINDGPIIWFSRKQGVIATSTTEAEYIAAHDAAKEVVWARALLEELHVKQPIPTVLHVDNAAAE